MVKPLNKRKKALGYCICLCSQPVFLNEVLVKLPSDPSSDEPVFHISHIDRVYTLKPENINERSVSAIARFISLISKPLFTGHMGGFMNR